MAPYKVIPNYVSRKDGKTYRVHVDPRTNRVIAAFPVKPKPNAVWDANQNKWLVPNKAVVKPAPQVTTSTVTPTPGSLAEDSTYLNSMAGDQLSRAQQRNQLGQAGALDQTDTAEALRRVGQQQGMSQSNYNANAARNNSLLSGRAMLGYGEMNRGYQQRTNDMQDAFARRGQARSTQMGAIDQGAGLYQQAQRAALAQRASGNVFNNRLALYQAPKVVKKVVK